MYDTVTTIRGFSDMPSFLSPIFERLNSWHSSEYYGSDTTKLTGTKLERSGPDDEGRQVITAEPAGIPFGPWLVTADRNRSGGRSC